MARYERSPYKLSHNLIQYTDINTDKLCLPSLPPFLQTGSVPRKIQQLLPEVLSYKSAYLILEITSAKSKSFCVNPPASCVESEILTWL